MNELKAKLRVWQKKNGNYILLVDHPVTYGRDYTDPTRKFANWIRRQSPDIITEFRGFPYYIPDINNPRYVDWWTNTYFVAYDVPPNIYMLLKLSWTYKLQEFNNRIKDGIPADPYNYFPLKYETPTAKALERKEKKTRVKLLKVDD